MNEFIPHLYLKKKKQKTETKKKKKNPSITTLTLLYTNPSLKVKQPKVPTLSAVQNLDKGKIIIQLQSNMLYS